MLKKPKMSNKFKRDQKVESKICLMILCLVNQPHKINLKFFSRKQCTTISRPVLFSITFSQKIKTSKTSRIDFNFCAI